MLTRNKKRKMRKMTKRKRVMKRGGTYPIQSVSDLEANLDSEIALLEKKIKKIRNPFIKRSKTRKLNELKNLKNQFTQKLELLEPNIPSAEFPSSESAKSFEGQWTRNPLFTEGSQKSSSQKSSSSGKYGFGSTPTE